MPGAEELKLEKPEIVKKNGNYAVKLRASAPSIHMMRAQIETEISPMVGGEQESQQLIDYLLGEYEEDTDKLWQSNIFGKSLYELVSEGRHGQDHAYAGRRAAEAHKDPWPHDQRKHRRDDLHSAVNTRSAPVML